MTTAFVLSGGASLGAVEVGSNYACAVNAVARRGSVSSSSRTAGVGSAFVGSQRRRREHAARLARGLQRGRPRSSARLGAYLGGSPVLLRPFTPRFALASLLVSLTAAAQAAQSQQIAPPGTLRPSRCGRNRMERGDGKVTLGLLRRTRRLLPGPVDAGRWLLDARREMPRRYRVEPWHHLGANRHRQIQIHSRR